MCRIVTRGRVVTLAAVAAMAVASPAAAGNSGELAPLPGRSACVGGPTSTEIALGVPEQGCEAVRGRSERNVEFVGLARTTVAVFSPDGSFLYTTTRGERAVSRRGRDVSDSAIEVFARTATGALRQLRGRDGCVNATGRHACAIGRGIEHVSALAIAPDGTALYAAANESNSIAVFRRNRHTGALRQLARRRGCLRATSGIDGCGRAIGLSNVSWLLTSADGRNVYAESLGIPVVFTAFGRDPATGALHQLPTGEGCFSIGSKRVSRACPPRRGVAENGTLSESPDGRFVTVSGASGPSAFARDPDRGALHQIAQPCQPVCLDARDEPSGDLVITPDGLHAYVLSAKTGEIAVWSRDPLSGVLTDVRTAYQVPCRPDECYMGPGSLALSASGRTAYAAFARYGLLVLARDVSTGQLTAAGSRCWALTAYDGCALARGLLAPEAVLIPRDGRNVYAVTRDFSISAFTRAGD
jgi:6-phosphogluconolactonase (cycloisomerase 2 family)